MTLPYEGDDWPIRRYVPNDEVRAWLEMWSAFFNDAIKSGMGLSEARDHADKRAAETEREER